MSSTTRMFAVGGAASLGCGGFNGVSRREEIKESFVFEVLDTLTPSQEEGYNPADDLAALEDMWLEKLSMKPDALHTVRLRRPSR